MYQYYIQVSLSLSFFTIISSCISVFCIRGLISGIFHLTQPFKQCRPQTAGPSPILFCSLAYIYDWPEGWTSLEVWNTLAGNMLLCVYQRTFAKNLLSLQHNFVDLLSVTCHGNKILLRRLLTYKSICRCNVLWPHVVATCHLEDCLRD